MKVEILPSLLAADYAILGSEILRAEAAGADALHIDIMDPTFVPNMSFGPDIVKLCRRVAPKLRRNVHLMMNRPDRYLEAFAAAGAQELQLHLEADCDLHVELRRVREFGMKNAIVINPETPVERLAPYLGEVDGVLVMTVHPGYGGQKFIVDCLEKLTWLRTRAPGLDLMIDGGANAETIPAAFRAGANQFVAGSYLYHQSDMKATISSIRLSCVR